MANFDSVLREFGGSQFKTNTVLNAIDSAEARNLSRYEVGFSPMFIDCFYVVNLFLNQYGMYKRFRHL